MSTGIIARALAAALRSIPPGRAACMNGASHINGAVCQVAALLRRLEKYLWAFMHCRIAVHFQVSY